MSKLSVYINLFKIAIRYPRSILQHLNSTNIRTLQRALINEPPSQIISNAKDLLFKTNKESVGNAIKNVKVFTNSINSSTSEEYGVYISHEATRTGAPLIILKVGQDLHKHYNIKPIYILCRGGILKKEFKNNGYCYNLQFPHNQVLLKKEMTELLNHFKGINIKAVFFNSEGSTFLLKHFAKHKIGPRVSLIHEMGNYYPKNAWKHVNTHSDKIVFPAKVMKEQAIKNSSFDNKKINVRGQGLLKPELLNIDKAIASTALRKKLQLPLDSKIVLGCGSPIARKGIDIFISTAIAYFSQYGDLKTYFVWLGDAPNNEHQIWANRDIIQSGFSSNIILQNGVEDISIWFSGSNIFYLTSRGDPYPCVVHEALACGLPVFGYKNSGGLEEMVSDANSFVVSFGNIVAIITMIYKYTRKDSTLFDPKSIVEHAKKSLNFKDYTDYLYKLIIRDEI